MTVVVGLDLALRASGMVAVPSDWDQEWKRVQRETFITKKTDSEVRVDTIAAIATRVADFVRRSEATDVFLEDYPRHIRSPSTWVLAEVVGATLVRIREWTGLEVTRVNMSDCRKLLLGKLPPAALAKRTVFHGLLSCSAPFEDDHQTDAFCVANWGLSELGLWCLSAA